MLWRLRGSGQYEVRVPLDLFLWLAARWRAPAAQPITLYLDHVLDGESLRVWNAELQRIVREMLAAAAAAQLPPGEAPPGPLIGRRSEVLRELMMLLELAVLEEVRVEVIAD